MTKRKSVVHKIGIFGEIDYESLDEFAQAWLETMSAYQAGDRIEVLINSPGGDLDAGIGIYEMMKTSRAPFTTRGLGLVGSTAVLIFQAGTHRELTEGSYIFLHEGSVEVAGSTRTMQSYSAHNHAIHQWYCRQIADRAGLALQAITKLAEAETFVDAPTSAKLGLTDDIISYAKATK